MSTPNGWFKGATVEDIVRASSLDLVGSRYWKALYDHTKSLLEVLSLGEHDFVKLGFTQNKAKAFFQPFDVKRSVKLLESKQLKILTIDDKNYPPLLKQIVDPPLWLFYKGDAAIMSEKCLTVVGSRKASENAYASIDILLPEQLIKSVVTVSGLAYGIDKYVHLLSLKNNRPTVAVLAGGLDSIYPPIHTNLATKIVDSGGVLVSEYPPMSRPLAFKFPVRNRIIAGLSPVTIVVEAALKSGSLTTTRSALENNREVFAIPGDVTRKTSEGPNFLIATGATPFIRPIQLMRLYGITKKSVQKSLFADDWLMSIIGNTGKTLDELVEESGRDLGEVMVQLTELEISDLIYQNELGKYLRKR